MSNSHDTKRIYCNHCKNSTHHTLIAAYDYGHGEGDEPTEWGEYRFWKCAGCDTGTMEDWYTADFMVVPSEDDEDDLVQDYASAYYPKRAHSIRPRKYFVRLPEKLGRLYGEVISAYNEDLRILCASGLRALVEGICADKDIHGPNLEQKIGGMTRLLPPSIVTNLHGFRFIGNRAVHEVEAPRGHEMQLAIDVIEDILNFLYALDYKASLFGKIKAAQEDKAASPSPAPEKHAEVGQSAPENPENN